MKTAKQLVLGLVLSLMTGVNAIAMAENPQIITNGVSYSESVLPYEGGLLVSNFGRLDIDGHLEEKLGHVTYIKDGKVRGVIQEGVLSKPTAMIVKDGVLYICDNDNIKLFDVQRPGKILQQIAAPKGYKVTNALALDGDTLYLTMTNPGAIYKMDVTDARNPGKLKLWTKLAGANGITVKDGVAYVVTIPVDYKTLDDKFVVYSISGEKHPTIERFRDVPALYDGAALNEGGSKLYVSDWSTGSVRAIDVATKEEQVVYEEAGIGPADIAVADGKVFIPDLVHSRIIITDEIK